VRGRALPRSYFCPALVSAVVVVSTTDMKGRIDPVIILLIVFTYITSTLLFDPCIVLLLLELSACTPASIWNILTTILENEV
jgi:hypothetical protein